MVSTVESRDRDRERLMAQIETNADYFGDGFGFPMAAVGLAPIVEDTAAGSPLCRSLCLRTPCVPLAPSVATGAFGARYPGHFTRSARKRADLMKCPG